MQIFQILVYLVMWIYVLFGAMASGHPGTSNHAWRSSKHARHQTQENDVIKSDHEKKVLHKTSPTSKTKPPTGVTNVRRVSKSKSNENLKLSFFLRMDSNRDGFVSAREYARAEATAMREARMVIQNFDQNNDNLVSRDEYLHVTGTSVVHLSKKKSTKRECSVEQIHSCAERFIRRLVRGKGHVRCGKISVFFKCISKHSRKCDSDTRRTLETTLKSISKSLHAKRKCGSSVTRDIWRHRGAAQKNSRGTVSYSSTNVLACSRDAIKALLLGKGSCDFATQYKICLQRSSKQLPRPVRRRLRHSSRTLKKVCRRVRGYD